MSAPSANLTVETVAGAFVPAVPANSSRARYVIRRLFRMPTFVVSFVIAGFWVFDAIFWRLLVPNDPYAVDPLHTLRAPSWGHLFGTDEIGRDVLSRVLAGATSILIVAPIATAGALLIGVTCGLVAGYKGGLIDEILMRVIDTMVSIPLIVFAVIVLGLLGPSKLNLIVVIAVVFGPYVTRTVRAATLAQRERLYVEAARLRGENAIYIMVREILPNVTGPIVVEGTVRFGLAVFVAATLSFLGLGLQQPSPDWGLTISIDLIYMQEAWWTVLAPVLALASLLMSVSLLADAMRKALSE